MVQSRRMNSRWEGKHICFDFGVKCPFNVISINIYIISYWIDKKHWIRTGGHHSNSTGISPPNGIKMDPDVEMFRYHVFPPDADSDTCADTGVL